jgi:CubicO group peptidase (beta-lactamase class C family)
MNRRDFFNGGVAASALMVSALALPKAFAAGAVSADDRFEEVARVVGAEMERLGVPGAALGILKDGVFQLRGFGVTNIENPQPVDDYTIFNLASLSKTVTATAVMRLVEQGSLDLDAPVHTWLPDWQVGDDASSREMLLRHLVTHSTGLNGPASTQDLGVETLGRFAQSMEGLVRIAPPGQVWSYLNPGFALSGRLIEVATGSDIHTAFRDLVFDPLGLTLASTRLDQMATHRLAVGHQPGKDGAPEVVRPFSMGSSIPAGGVSMCISDLMRYAAFHLNEGDAGKVDVLTPATRELMQQPQIAKAPTEDFMGIGWHLRTVGGVKTVAHGGTAGAGHRLLLELVPERRLAFAILTNHTEGWRLNQVVEHALLKAYEGLELTPNQKIAYRGINEDFSLHASPLAPQPDLAAYAGHYTRGAADPIDVKAEGGQLMVGDVALNVYAPDLTFAANNGTPTEFIRNADGVVTWIRQNGQGFALKSA